MTTAKGKDSTINSSNFERLYSEPLNNGEEEPVKILSHPLVEQAHESLMMAVSYLAIDQQSDIEDACYFGDVAHIKDKRKSGEPYITHPIAVAEIIAGFRLDRDTIIAAILHDTVEDTEVTLEQIVDKYGDKVAQLVDGVTKLKSSKHNKQQNKAATFHKILLSTIDDPRVLIIKLSDRLHNMSTLGAVRKEKQQATARETLDFYIPLARVMGMNNIADYIEILCYRNLDYEMYTKLSDKLLQHGLGRKLRKEGIHDYLQKILNKINISGHVKILDNHVTLYRQFFHNRGKIDKLIRQYTFELIVDDIDDCKNLAHYLIEKYHIPTSQIFDNISNPLPGGNQSLNIFYNSLHDDIEINIMTRDMLRTARLGIIGADNASEVSQSVIQASLRNLKGVLFHGYGNADIEDENNFSHSDLNFDDVETTIDDLISYLHERKILCYSPQGKAYELPRGSTALDFAYAVGPFVGHVAVSAKIEGEEVDLATVVRNGQQIEIITDKSSVPKAEWLGFVGSAKARALISRWLKDLSVEDKQEQGKHALERALQTYDKQLENLSATDWKNLLEWRKLNSKEELYEQITSANLLPQLVVARLFSEEIADKLDDPNNLHTPESLLATLPGVEISFPKCCNPLYGDPIIGYNSKSHGLVIHRHKCYELQEVRDSFPQRIFHIKWRENDHEDNQYASEQALFPAYLNLNMLINDEQLSQTLIRLKELNIGLEKVDTRPNTTILHVIVRSRKNCEHAIEELRNLLGFTRIERMYQLGSYS